MSRVDTFGDDELFDEPDEKVDPQTGFIWEDERDSALYQLELEERQYLEEWEKEYLQWLSLQYQWWWQALDKDSKWIEEHGG